MAARLPLYYQHYDLLYSLLMFDWSTMNLKSKYGINRPELKILITFKFLMRLYGKLYLRAPKLRESGLFQKGFNFSKYLPGLAHKRLLDQPMGKKVKSYSISNMGLQLLEKIEMDFATGITQHKFYDP